MVVCTLTVKSSVQSSSLVDFKRYASFPRVFPVLSFTWFHFSDHNNKISLFLINSDNINISCEGHQNRMKSSLYLIKSEQGR